MTKKPPILIAGPTASGKSALALELAARLDGVIINADALQVYGLWRVLTARPSAADEALAPHHLYGHVDPAVSYSAGEWLREVTALLEGLGERQAIIIGGTGLYFSSLLNGLAEIPAIPSEVRAKGDAMRLGGASAFEMLADLDPVTWGVPVCLDVEKDWLNARIARRFDLMLNEGALEECEAWMARDLPMTLPAAKALGAAEIIAHLKGEMSLEDARESATIATRQFAKRQRTWFRSKMKDWWRIDIADLGAKHATERILEGRNGLN